RTRPAGGPTHGPTRIVPEHQRPRTRLRLAPHAPVAEGEEAGRLGPPRHRPDAGPARLGPPPAARTGHPAPADVTVPGGRGGGGARPPPAGGPRGRRGSARGRDVPDLVPVGGGQARRNLPPVPGRGGLPPRRPQPLPRPLLPA